MAPKNLPLKPGASADLICRAIRERHLLTFDYNGQPRVVAPYCYGLSTRDAEVLRAIQVGGASGSGGFGFGKLWTVAQMKKVKLSEQTFVANDPNYNPDDSAMKQIICRVERG
jgi:hypothetical protein